MLLSIHYITAFAIIATGFYVLFHGDWHKFQLKYAAVALSTVAAVWLLAFTAYQGNGSCKLHSEILCISYGIYGIVRNIAFVLFHISVGRDAIMFKQKDRRKQKKNVIKMKKAAHG